MMNKKLILIIFLFWALISWCFGGFVFPPDILRTKYTQFGNTVDLFSHHNLGTFVAYDESYGAGFVTGDNGWVRIHIFRWTSNGFSQSYASPYISDMIGWSVGIDEYGNPFLVEDDNILWVMNVSEIEMSGSTLDNVINIVALVKYFDFVHITWLNVIYLLRFDVTNNTFIGEPTWIVRRCYSHYSGGGLNICDIAFVTNNSNNSILYWTEYTPFGYENRVYYLAEMTLINNRVDWNQYGTFLADLGSGIGYNKAYIDAVFDNARNETYIAVDRWDNWTNYNIAIYLDNGLNHQYIGTILGGHTPTIDCYRWTSGRDFAITYERWDGQIRAGIGFSRFIEGSGFTNFIVTDNNYAAIPSIICYTWGTNPQINSTEIVAWQQNGECRLYRRTGSIVDTNIILACQKPNHPSSTPGNKKPLLATPSRNSTPLGGFYAIWTNLPNAIYGKRSHDVAFKIRTVYANYYCWKNSDGMPFYADTPPLELHLEGHGALGIFTYTDGMLEYIINNWQSGDQVYSTQVTYLINSQQGNLNVVYVDNHWDNTIRNDPFLIQHQNSPPYPRSFTTDTSAHWNFWDYFPATNNYLGFYIPLDFPGYNNFTTIIQYSYPNYSFLDLKYIDWEP